MCMLASSSCFAILLAAAWFVSLLLLLLLLSSSSSSSLKWVWLRWHCRIAAAGPPYEKARSPIVVRPWRDWQRKTAATDRGPHFWSGHYGVYRQSDWGPHHNEQGPIFFIFSWNPNIFNHIMRGTSVPAIVLLLELWWTLQQLWLFWPI